MNFQVSDWTSQCESARSLLQSKEDKVNDQPVDVPDGFSPISRGKIDKKSPKLFRVVSRLVLRTNIKNSSSPEKKQNFTMYISFI